MTSTKSCYYWQFWLFLFACATFPSRFGLLNMVITNDGKDCSRRNCKWIKNSKCVFTSRYWRSLWPLNEACWQSQCCYGGHSLLTGRYFKHCYCCCYYFILFFGWEYLFDFSSQNYVNKLWLEIFFFLFWNSLSSWSEKCLSYSQVLSIFEAFVQILLVLNLSLSQAHLIALLNVAQKTQVTLAIAISGVIIF